MHYSLILFAATVVEARVVAALLRLWWRLALGERRGRRRTTRNGK